MVVDLELRQFHVSYKILCNIFAKQKKKSFLLLPTTNVTGKNVQLVKTLCRIVPTLRNCPGQTRVFGTRNASCVQIKGHRQHRDVSYGPRFLCAYVNRVRRKIRRLTNRVIISTKSTLYLARDIYLARSHESRHQL